MLTPCSASFSAMPRPIPRELPVISACFPWSGIATSCCKGFSAHGLHKAHRAHLFRQRLGAGLGNLGILLGGDTGHADRANDLAVHDEWDATLKRAGAAQSQQPEVGATLANEVLEQLGGTSVEDRRAGLVLGD